MILCATRGWAVALAAVLGCNGKSTASGTASPFPSPSDEPLAAPASSIPQTGLPPITTRATVPTKLGTHEIRAEVCKLDASAPWMQCGDGDEPVDSVEIGPDGSVFVLEHGHVRKYRSPAADAPCELVADRSFGRDGVLALPIPLPKRDKATTLSMDQRGTLYVDGTGFPLMKIEGSSVVRVCDDPEQGRVDKQGTSLISWHAVRDFGTPQCAGKTFLLEGWSESKYGYADLRPYDDDLAVSGSGGRGLDNFFRVGLATPDGRMTMVVGKKDGPEKICYPKTIEKSPHGMLVVDSNCRALKLWAEDGAFQGTTDLDELTGVSLWPVDMRMRGGVGFLVGTVTGNERYDGGNIHFGVVVRITEL